MNEPDFRPATINDGAEIVALNGQSVTVTSPLDSERYRYLYDVSSFTIVAEIDGSVAGFMMAMTDDSGYDNANYLWFSARLKRFVYVDRVVVSQSYRSLGIGRSFYSYLENWASEADLLSIAPEMDLNPPNPRSLSFHLRQGFAQIGTRRLEIGKTVSMQVRCL